MKLSKDFNNNVQVCEIIGRFPYHVCARSYFIISLNDWLKMSLVSWSHPIFSLCVCIPDDDWMTLA